MTDPTEKINYTLTLVDGADAARARRGLPVYDPLAPAGLRLALACNDLDRLPWPDMAQAWADSDMDEYNRAMHAFVQIRTALDAFVALLPEPPKKATE